MESRDRTYHDQVDSITSDKRGRIVPVSNLRRKVLLLDAARVEVPLSLKGDFLFVDRGSSGTITLKLNNSSEDPIPLQALDEVADIPFEEILVSHPAQAGLIVNLWYGYRARFRANAQTITSIGSITNPVQVRGDAGTIVAPTIVAGTIPVVMREAGYSYGASFNSSTLRASNTPDTVFAPGSNVNGAILWTAEFQSRNTGAAQTAAYLAKTSAPATAFDGDFLCGIQGETVQGTDTICTGRLPRPVVIPAGKGVYWIGTIGETSTTQRGALYTLL